MKSKCTLPEGGTINVRFEGGGHTFRRGDEVDLDEVIVPATANRSADTWRDALGEHADAHFAAPGDAEEFWGDDSPAQE